MTTRRADYKRREYGDPDIPGIGLDFGYPLRGVIPVGRGPGMTLGQFKSFAAVAKHSSLTKASAELRVTQPSISQQLRVLEAIYGAKLYRRLSKGIEITEAGQVLLRDVTAILALVAKLGEACKPLSRDLVCGVLRVGGTFSASALLIPGLLARFRRRHPKAELEFCTGSSKRLEGLVAASAMDVAVTDREARSHELYSERLRREKVAAFVLPGHPLARREAVKLDDLLAQPLIIRGGRGISGTTETAFTRLREQGWVPRIAMRCDSPEGIKAAVRRKMGVGIAFEDSIKAEIDSGEFKILKVRGLELEAESFIVYARNRPLSPLAQEFLELLRGVRRRQKFNVSSSSSIVGYGEVRRSGRSTAPFGPNRLREK